MIEKGKISSFQMAIIVVMLIISTALLTVPAVTEKHAYRDMWMSPIWASLNGVLTAAIVYQLHKMYPKKTIIQYTPQIMGKIFGKAIGFIFLFYFLHASGLISFEYANVINTLFLVETPSIILTGSMILVCAFAVRGGVEILGRSAGVFSPIYLFPLSLFLLLLPDLKFNNLLPVMENGILPSIKGALIPQVWFSEVFLISMLIPFVTDNKTGVKPVLFAVLFAMITMVYINLVTLFLFGDSLATYSYPVFSVFKYVEIPPFFEHIESVVIVIWVTGVFIKLSLFFYALVLGTAQWIGLNNYRSLVFPLSFIVLLFGKWVSPNLQELNKFLETISPYYTTSIFTVIPMFLLLVSIIRRKIENSSKKSINE